MYLFRIYLDAVFASMVIGAAFLRIEIAAAETIAVIIWKTAATLFLQTFSTFTKYEIVLAVIDSRMEDVHCVAARSFVCSSLFCSHIEIQA